LEFNSPSLHRTQGGSGGVVEPGSWLSNYGQLRRSTDRFTTHRLAQVALAIVLTIMVKLIDFAERYNR
jgi:hypothetical protein